MKNFPTNISKEVNLTVLGDVMIDKYWKGKVNRISPEAPVPILKADEIETRAGGAANVANNIASLGGTVSIFGIIGDDDNGKELSSLIDRSNLNNHLTVHKKLKTTTKLRFLANNQQLLRVDFEENNFVSNKIHENSKFLSNLKKTDLIVLSDYNKGTLSNVQDIIKITNSLNKISIIDPKGSSFDKYYGATIITPNLLEFEQIVGPCNDNSVLEEKAKILIKKLKFKHIIVTRGSEGLSVFSKNEKGIHLKTEAKEVFDVTGAGDTLIATLGFFIAHGLTVHQSAQIANSAASFVVAKSGTSTINLAELIPKFSLKFSQNKSLYNKEEIRVLVDNLKKLNKKIVFTNGCFDILHPGHLHLLQKAKELGDVLIVGINEDSSVRELKGILRPINKISDRIEMMSNIKTVDIIIPFKEKTPIELIKLIIPDILVKGGDYKADKVIGNEIVRSNGGDVIVIDFLKGFSSSNIINKIKDA